MRLPVFYPILDLDSARRCGFHPVQATEEILSAGAHILQFRFKGFFDRQVFSDLEKIADLCRQANALLVVNDRADLAVLIGAAAVHLGQEDLSPTDARLVVGDNLTIGYSTHNERQLRRAASQPVDYVALGPIFGTKTKANPDPVLGVDELRRLRPLTDRPLVAIGGITRANARSVIEAGADSVAVIGDLFPSDGASLRSRVQEWLSLVLV
jgi:thiamine-phosphate pyrophosphorylase